MPEPLWKQTERRVARGLKGDLMGYYKAKDYIKCKHCGYHRALLTAWEPPSGLDPGQRQYRCKLCKELTHVVFKSKEGLPR